MTYFDASGMKYWDDFNRRANETINALRHDQIPPLRRISIHVTNACNFGCKYCNEVHHPMSLSYEMFAKTMKEYSEMGGGIVHVTGGEPTVVKNFSDYIREAGKYDNIQFHVNSNFYSKIITPDLFPMIARIKVSLDSADPEYFNSVVNRKQAFEVVTHNLDVLHHEIECGNTNTVVSLTFTVTKENYKGIPEFLEMYESRWPKFYACFFSSYKGTNPLFVMTPVEVEDFFTNIVPQLDEITTKYGDLETLNLFHASHERRTFKTENRFPENRKVPCYLQLSELVIDERGEISNCSHLFRDNVPTTGMNIADGHLRDLFITAKTQHCTTPINIACLYGCNKKLTAFNDIVYQHTVANE